MGGMAGVVFGGHDCAKLARSMAAMMPYRGIDGKTEACGEGVSFVSLYRRPNLEYSPQPPQVQIVERTYVMSDCRLDNRTQLMAELGLSEATDNELIYAAWVRWGEGFSERLLGDFAFAIYSEYDRSLILGRDPFGVKPLFYSWTESGLAVSSEIAVISTCFQKHAVNLLHMRDFLVGGATDSDEVMIEGIFRVPAAHVIRIDADKTVHSRCYWDVNTIAVSSAASPTELWRLITTAVRDRSKNTGSVGFALSGGLDSTSLCYAAASCGETAILPLRTFSIVFDRTPSENERPYIEAALTGLPAKATFVDMSDYDPLDELEEHIGEQARLYQAPGLVMNGKLYRMISNAGCSVLIDGHGGDEVISHGFQRLSELAAEKEWIELWRCSAAASLFFGTSRVKVFATYWLRYATHRLPSLRKRLAGLLWPQEQGDELLGRTLQELKAKPAKTTGKLTSAKNSAHIASLFNPTVADSLEVIELAAARRGVEIRFPFFDRRVIEYALSIPEASKLDGPWTRAILREAMKGSVPDKVRLRTDKFDFSPHVARGILKSAGPSLVEACSNSTFSGLINIERIKGAIKSLQENEAKPNLVDVFAIWRAIAVFKWLEVSRKEES